MASREVFMPRTIPLKSAVIRNYHAAFGSRVKKVTF